MKTNRYFLHGDADPNAPGTFYCGACDVFVDESHFALHGDENWLRLERSIKKLKASDLAVRPESAYNLAHKWAKNGGVKLFELLHFRFKRIPLTKKQRFEVLRRDGYRCQLCGASASDGARLEVDHKVAVARGGGNNSNNLWTLCFECNSGKRAGEL